MGVEGCRWSGGVASGKGVGMLGRPKVLGAQGIPWHLFGDTGVRTGKRGLRWAYGGRGGGQKVRSLEKESQW